MFLTLFKAVDQAEVEAQYERVRKEGYYTNLRVLKAAAKIKQVKPIMPPPASRKAAKTVRKAASAKARKPSVIRLTTAPGKIRKVVAPKKKTSAKTKTATKKAAKKKATKTTKSTKTTKAKKATKATKSTKTTKSVKAKKSTKKKAATAKSAKKATTKKKKAKR
jgi:aconitate hydratase